MLLLSLMAVLPVKTELRIHPMPEGNPRFHVQFPHQIHRRHRVIGPNRVLGLRSLCTLVTLLLASLATQANDACDTRTTGRGQALTHLVDSIRLDKSGLARVYA